MRKPDHWEGALEQMLEGERESRETAPNLRRVRTFLEKSVKDMRDAQRWEIVPEGTALSDLLKRQNALKAWLEAKEEDDVLPPAP